MSALIPNTDAINPDVMLPDLLREFPSTRPVLDRHGLRGCGGRNGPAETLGFFARTHGVDQPLLLRELRDAIAALARAAEAPQRANIADMIYRRFFVAAIV